MGYELCSLGARGGALKSYLIAAVLSLTALPTDTESTTKESTIVESVLDVSV